MTQSYLWRFPVGTGVLGVAVAHGQSGVSATLHVGKALAGASAGQASAHATIGNLRFVALTATLTGTPTVTHAWPAVQTYLWDGPVSTNERFVLLAAAVGLSPTLARRQERLATLAVTIPVVGGVFRQLPQVLTANVTGTPSRSAALIVAIGDHVTVVPPTVTNARTLALTDAIVAASHQAVRTVSPLDRIAADFTATQSNHDVVVHLTTATPVIAIAPTGVNAPVTVGVTPPTLVLHTGDTGRALRFRVLEDASALADPTTILPIDLTGATVEVRIRRYGSLTNLYAGTLSDALVLPTPPSLLVPVSAAGAQTVRVTSTAGLGAGNAVAMGAGTANEEDLTITTIVDSTHLTATFTKTHSAGDYFTLPLLALVPTVATAVTGSGVAQSIAVSSSSGLAVGNVITIGAGTANVETVTLTAIADGTHISGIFTKNHSVGDQIQFASAPADPVYNAVGGYCTYKVPSGGMPAAATYVAQLFCTFPDGTTDHSEAITITVKQGL